ncbi:hypothetical protein BS17DRAFT_269171 [Gyrodon lividus]|nr:hypothetical protein BS17DRAFT_269171 [Gyrodon lividus]
MTGRIVAFKVRNFFQAGSKIWVLHFVFVAKLVSGPWLAAEKRRYDFQSSEHRFRHAPFINLSLSAISGWSCALTSEERSLLDPAMVHAVLTQPNHTLSEILASLVRARFWESRKLAPTVQAPQQIPSNSTGPVMIPDIVARRSVEYVMDFKIPLQGSYKAERSQTVQGLRCSFP